MFDKTSKYMRFMRNLWFIFILIIAFMACSDDKDVLAPVPNDVTLNELELDRFTHAIPDGGFTSKAAHRNSVTLIQRKIMTGRMPGLLIRTGITVPLRGRLLKRLWIQIFIVCTRDFPMRMKYMLLDGLRAMILILRWELRPW